MTQQATRRPLRLSESKGALWSRFHSCPETRSASRRRHEDHNRRAVVLRHRLFARAGCLKTQLNEGLSQQLSRSRSRPCPTSQPSAQDCIGLYLVCRHDSQIHVDRPWFRETLAYTAMLKYDHPSLHLVQTVSLGNPFKGASIGWRVIRGIRRDPRCHLTARAGSNATGSALPTQRNLESP